MMKPHFEQILLPNQLRVVAIERPLAQTALLSFDVRAGSRYETAEDHGLSHFLEHMVFQGCEGYPSAQAVNRAAESYGAAIDAATMRDSTHFEHLISPENLSGSAALMSALLTNPAFNEIESERQIILEEALDELDENGRCIDAETLSRRLLWPHSPMGQSVIGNRKRIAQFGVSDLQRFHKTHYGARNMVATVVGPDDPQRMLDVVSAHLAKIPEGALVEPDPAGENPMRPELERVEDQRSQCDCRLIYPTPGRNSQKAFGITVLRLCLDDGLASRLPMRLGNELGLAYDQWANWDTDFDAGAFELGAEMSPKKLLQFIEEGHGLLRGLIEDPPRGEELDRIHFRARWAIQAALDTADGLTALYGTPLLYEEHPLSPEERLQALNAVTTDELSALASELFKPDHSVTCVVGPTTKQVRKQLEQAILKL